MKESVIMFSLRDHFLVLKILHISPGLFILQDTKNEILKTSSLKKIIIIGVLLETLSLKTPTTISSETPQVSLRPKPFHRRTSDFHWRPQTFSSSDLIKTCKLFIGNPEFLLEPTILIGDQNYSSETPDFH